MTSSRAMVPAPFQLMQRHAALPQSPSPAVRPAALCRNLKKCAAEWMKSNYMYCFFFYKSLLFQWNKLVWPTSALKMAIRNTGGVDMTF